MVTALVAALCMAGYPDVTDVSGTTYKMSGRAATVVVFVTVDCPIANQYQAELERQRQQFEPQGVGYFQVHVDPDVTPARARDHAKEYGAGSRLVIDKGHTLVKAFDARLTPEAFVLDRGGKLVYRGRIDDRYAGLGNQKPTPKSRDLADAVRAVVAGKKPAVAKTAGYGCLIPRLSSD